MLYLYTDSQVHPKTPDLESSDRPTVMIFVCSSQSLYGPLRIHEIVFKNCTVMKTF